MALDAPSPIAPYDAPQKDLYEIGEMPPLGHVPKQMYAWIRPCGWRSSKPRPSTATRCWSS